MEIANDKKLQNKLEKIFSELNVEYKIIDLQDDDLNYELHISSTGVLKPLNYIHCICYLKSIDNSMNLLVPNIYKVSEKDNINFIYELVNKVNLNISLGAFSVFVGENKAKQLIYKSNYGCGEDFCDVDKEFVKNQFDLLILNLNYLFNELSKGMNNECE